MLQHSSRLRIHHVSASSFVPDNSGETYDRGAGLISPSGGDTNLQFHASLNLPDGASVTKVTGMFLDIGADDFTDIDLRLRCFSTTDPSTYPSTIMAEFIMRRV